MKKDQNIIINGARGCIASLEADRKSWEKIPQISKKLTEVRSDIEQALLLDAEAQSLMTSVQTILLNNSLQIVGNKTYIICSKVHIYARETGNEHVLQFVKFTERQLMKGSNDNILDRCYGVVSKAESIIGDLQQFGVTHDEIISVYSLIIECRNMLGKRVAMQSERSFKLKQKNECVSRVSKNMTILDKMVEVFIADQAAAERYKNSRTSKRFIGNRTTKRKEEPQFISVAQA